jgi:hypothetical protein
LRDQQCLIPKKAEESQFDLDIKDAFDRVVAELFEKIEQDAV